MAKTRAQIKTAVDYNTGRGTEKAGLIESLCNEALKVACNAHPFRDARSQPSDFSITEDATSVDISSISNLIHVVSARIIESDADRYAPLVMKDRTWWDRNVVNASDNQKGWPEFGLRWGTEILLNRPADSGLSLRLVVTTEQSFTDDSTACPITILDTFVTQYVTAFVFLSLQQMDSYAFWKSLALGPKWDAGVIGGTLLHAINTDKIDLSEEFKAERYERERLDKGLSVENLISGHDDYGNIRTWY